MLKDDKTAETISDNEPESSEPNSTKGTRKEPTVEISASAIREEAERFLERGKKTGHSYVFQEILNSLVSIDFRERADLKDDEKPTQRHLRIIVILEVLRVAREQNCGLCLYQGSAYIYNGEYWEVRDQKEVEHFLRKASRKLGVDQFVARDYEFSHKLYKQFMADAFFAKPDTQDTQVLINLKNGTFEFTKGDARIREFRREDFLTYQLPFEFDPIAHSRTWQEFLDRVLPDKSKQVVLAEYIGYLFVRFLKLERTLILLGTGANGKSVFFDVICALLGRENVSNCSLENLGNEYYRATIATKLLNYSSEISHRLQADKFKQLTSGEPVEARLPYGQPMTLNNYARLAFNCNELPKDVEHSEAFFRRFLIVEFDVTIPTDERDPTLAKKIIETELPGVFNWVLDGLRRLLKQGGFSYSEAIERKLAKYRRESDSVATFLEEEGYIVSTSARVSVKDLYISYKTYCQDSGLRPLGRNNFVKRLESNNVMIMRQNVGKTAFVEQRR